MNKLGMLVGLAATVAASSVLADARVRVVHAAPFSDSLEGSAVTVTANGDTLLEDFRFGDFTDYVELPAGSYDLAVFPAGAEDPAMSASVELSDDVDYTVLATGNGSTQDLALWPLVDDADAPGDGNLNIRVVHAAPFAAASEDTEVSIRTAAGDVVNGLVGVPYFAESGYFAVPAGTYDLKVASNDGTVNFIDPLPADLPAGLDVTVIAIGDGINQPLGILALPVGALETRTPVDNSVNGWWESANEAEEGLALLPIPARNQLVGSVYTYAPDGSGEQRWFTLDSGEAGFDGREAMGTLYTASGATLAGDESANIEEAGTFGIEFISCSEAVLTAMLDGGAEATWTLNRVVQTVDCNLVDQSQ
ncbi:DUF4397 domain-containing protein [Wenzhouxiangella sp. EGI_FJ10409]|uniref:DUF4397 domain-containing protein n=1 Tax=Wenzhouxiangella sp. EGI_FJ10409 TaxID=3243767 RepID=UPI0035D83CC0